MKNIFLTIFILSFFSRSAGVEITNTISKPNWGALSNCAQMSLRLAHETNKFEPSEAITVVIMVRNLSTNDLFWGNHDACGDPDKYESRDIYFRITAPDGNEIWPDKSSKYRLGKNFCCGTDFLINPNDTNQFQIHFDTLQAMGCLPKFDATGTYKLIAYQKLVSLKTEQRLTVVSSPLFFDIISSRNVENKRGQSHP